MTRATTKIEKTEEQLAYDSAFSKYVVKLVERKQKQEQEIKNEFDNNLLELPMRLHRLFAIADLGLEGIEGDKFDYTQDQILNVVFDRWADIELVASVEDLRKLRQQFGRIELKEDWKQVYKPLPNHVKIPLEFKEVDGWFPLKVYVIRELSDDSKCQIVEVEETIKETKLICSK